MEGKRSSGTHSFGAGGEGECRGRLLANVVPVLSREEFPMQLFTRRVRPLAVALTAALLLPALGTAGGQEKGSSAWADLLEGGDLSRNWTTTGNWKLEADGVVSLRPRPGETGWTRFGAYLWSRRQYRDFEAEFDYKLDKGGNSGFYFHVGDRNSPVEKGIEVQLYDSGGKKAGEKLTDHDSGGIIPGIPPTKNAA